MATETDLFGLNLGLFDDDFFGLPLEPLSDFEVTFEDSEIDAFLEQFEAATDFNFDDVTCDVTGNTKVMDKANGSILHNNSAEINDALGNVRIRFSSKSKHVTEGIRLHQSREKIPKVKRKKGISLLAKPFKPKKQILQISRGERVSPTRFATYFYQDHNYCPTPQSSCKIKETQLDKISNESVNQLIENNELQNYVDILNDRSNISIETEVIMSFDYEEINNEDGFDERSLNGDNQCENSEGEIYSSNSDAEIDLQYPKLENGENIENQIITIESRSNLNTSSSIFRVRKISARSSVSSSRSSSISSNRSDCSCSSCSSDENWIDWQGG